MHAKMAEQGANRWMQTVTERTTGTEWKWERGMLIGNNLHETTRDLLVIFRLSFRVWI